MRATEWAWPRRLPPSPPMAARRFPFFRAPRINRAGGQNQVIGYTKAGAVTSFTPAAGAITNVNYNQAGRVAALMAGSNPAAQYTYDAFGHRLVKTASSTTLYQYDQEGCLLEETD